MRGETLGDNLLLWEKRVFASWTGAYYNFNRRDDSVAGSTLCCQQTIHAFGFVSRTGDKNHIGQRRGKATQHQGSQKYVSGFYNPLNPGMQLCSRAQQWV